MKKQKKIIRILKLFSLGFLLVACNRHTPWQGYIEGRFTYLASNGSGYLESLKVKRGDFVNAGQVIFALDNEPEMQKLHQAQHQLEQLQFQLANLQKGQREFVLESIEAQLEQTRAELELAKITVDRNQKLANVNAIAKEQYDQASASFKRSAAKLHELTANLKEAKLGGREDLIKAAQAAVDAGLAEVKQAQYFLAKKSISAIESGYIYDTYFRKGEFVTAGKPVVSMLTASNIKLIFYISQKQLGQVHLGQEVIVKCDGCLKPESAVIDFISSQAEFTPPFIFSETEREKFVFRVEARFTPNDALGLHPGQPVDVEIK